MSGGDRYIGAALAGLAALFTVFGLGLMVGSDTQEQRYQRYSYATDKPPEVSLTAPVTDAEAPKYKEPCRNPESSGESDLCAQWRAAYAAEDSAFWAEWGFWVSVAGMFGIFCALLLNLASNRAATNAERAHVRFHRTSKVRDHNGEIVLLDGKAQVLGVTFMNHGRTPALIKSLAIDFVLREQPPRPQHCKKRRMYAEDSVMTQDVEWPPNNAIKGWKEGADFPTLVAGHDRDGLRLFAYGVIVYHDAFGVPHETGFCRQFNGRNFVYNQGDVDPLNYAT